jgi:hypothetical protein
MSEGTTRGDVIDQLGGLVSGGQIDKLRLNNIGELLKLKSDNYRRIIQLSLIDGYTLRDVEKLVPENYNVIALTVSRFRKELKEASI